MKLTKWRIQSGKDARASNDSSHAGDKVAPGGVEHKPIDGLMESRKHCIGSDDEDTPQDRKDRGDALSYLDGIELTVAETHFEFGKRGME